MLRKILKGTNSCSKRHLSLVAQTITFPDTQTQTSVTNKPEFVKEFRGCQITLLGIGGSGIPAQVVELSFILRYENKKPFKIETLDVYAQQVSVVVLSHHGVRKAGFKVDYDEDRMLTPDGYTIKMRMQDSVWTVPVFPPNVSVTVRVFDHRSPPAPFTMVVTNADRPKYIQYHETLFLPGVTKFFTQYHPSQGVYCGTATKTNIRKYIETHPSISLGLGTSKYVSRRQKSDRKATEITTEEQVIIHY